MSKAKFTHELGGDAVLALSKEKGVVIGRAEYDNGNENAYLVRYAAGDGCQRESWFNESAISQLKAKKEKPVAASEDDEDEEATTPPKKSKSAPAKAGKKAKAEDEDAEEDDETEADEDADEEAEDDAEEDDETEADDEEDEESDLTFEDDVEPAAALFLKKKGPDALRAVLKKFKVKKADQLKAAQYEAFLAAVKLKKKKQDEDDEE